MADPGRDFVFDAAVFPRQQKKGYFEAVNVAQSEKDAVVTTMFGRYDPGYSGTAREYCTLFTLANLASRTHLAYASTSQGC
jgi:hypothetical protein